VGAQPHLGGVPIAQRQVWVVPLRLGHDRNGIEPIHTGREGGGGVGAGQGTPVGGDRPGGDPGGGGGTDVLGIHGRCGTRGGKPGRGNWTVQTEPENGDKHANKAEATTRQMLASVRACSTHPSASYPFGKTFLK